MDLKKADINNYTYYNKKSAPMKEPSTEYDLILPQIKQSYDFIIYASGSKYYAMNGKTGVNQFNSTDLGALVNSCIGQITNAGRIYIGQGTYSLSTAIDLLGKSIVLQGVAMGAFDPPSWPGTYILVTNGFADWCIKNTPAHYAGYYAQIRDIVLDGGELTTPLGGIQWKAMLYGTIRNVYVKSFHATLAGQGFNGTGISLEEDDPASPHGCFFNVIENLCSVNNTIGVYVGPVANFNYIYNGHIETNRTGIISKGVLTTGNDTTTLQNVDIEGFGDTGQMGVHCNTHGTYGGSATRFFGCRFESNLTDILIDNLFTRCIFDGNYHYSTVGGWVPVTDNNASTNNKAMYGQNWGNRRDFRGTTATVSDGGTITHNLLTTPTGAVAIGSVANEIIAVTALGATTFTVAIKKRSDGTAGTAQTIYWWAYLI